MKNSNSGIKVKKSMWGSTQSKKKITLNDNDVEIINMKGNCKSKMSLGENYVSNPGLSVGVSSTISKSLKASSLKESVEFIQD